MRASERRLLGQRTGIDEIAQQLVRDAPAMRDGVGVAHTLYRAAGVLDFTDNDKQTEAINRRLFAAPIEPWWMRAYGVLKAIASTALLFLAALGLRNRYRLK